MDRKFCYLIVFLLLITGCFPRIDREAPDVSLNIYDGMSVSDTSEIKVYAWDEQGISLVELYIDDTLAYSSTNAESGYVTYYWNTFLEQNNSSHILYAIAQDQHLNTGFSDTVAVTIYNYHYVNLPFYDGFETYYPGDYPSSGWFELVYGSDAVVTDDYAHGGVNSFRLTGYTDYPRIDCIKVYNSNIDKLSYECALMIPLASSTGSAVGFVDEANYSDNPSYNYIKFRRSDSLIVIKGSTTEISTGQKWAYDTWYSIKVEINFRDNTLDAWVDSQPVATDIQSATRDLSNIFCLATEKCAFSMNMGTVYFDDVKLNRLFK